MMKKLYMKPHTELICISNVDALCDGLKGWSAYKESNGNLDSGDNTGEEVDPPFGSDAKHFNAWTTWDE